MIGALARDRFTPISYGNGIANTVLVSEIQAVEWTDLLLCWENTNPPPDVLTQNPKISRVFTALQ